MINVDKWLLNIKRYIIEVIEIFFKEINYFVRRVFKSYEMYKKFYLKVFKYIDYWVYCSIDFLNICLKFENKWDKIKFGDLKWKNLSLF